MGSMETETRVNDEKKEEGKVMEQGKCCCMSLEEINTVASGC